MCLSFVTKRTRLPSRGHGWKEFDMESRNLVFGVMGGRVKTDVWLKAVPMQIKAIDGQRYEAGFHVYKTLSDYVKHEESEYWSWGPEEREESDVEELFRRGNLDRYVLWRKPICLGTQNDEDVIVVRELFIPSRKTLRKLRYAPRRIDQGLKRMIFALPLGERLKWLR